MSFTEVIQPGLEPQYDVRIETIVYAKGDVFVDGTVTKMDLLLDLYQPTDAPKGLRPPILFVHGGAFFRGHRAHPTLVAAARGYAARGYVVASIEYRMTFDNPVPSERVQGLADMVKPHDNSWVEERLGVPEAQFEAALPAAMDDTLTAIGWLSDQAEELSLDTSRLTLLGASAGAITAINTTYLSNNLGLPSPDVAAMIDLWGCFMYSTDVAELEADEPPLFIVHGTEDPTVPYELSEMIVARAKSVGVYYEFYPLEGYAHGFDAIDIMTVEVNGKTIFDLSVKFLDKVLFGSR